MKIKPIVLLLAGALSIWQAQAQNNPPLATVTPVGVKPTAVSYSGIDANNFDTTVRPQDDFYQYANGAWLKKTEIPSDKSRYGAFHEIDDKVQAKLRELIEAASAPAASAEKQKIGNLFQSFMDVAMRDAKGFAPLAADMAKINAMKTHNDLPALFAMLGELGVKAPFDISIAQDARNATRYAVYASQGGLGLPDRDYYLKEDDARLKDAKQQYRNLIEKMLGKLGETQAATQADAILALETELARAQWTRVENRDPVKTYNKFALGKLDTVIPGFDWKQYLAAAKLGGKVNDLIVSQPSYFKSLSTTLTATPLDTWKAYFRWHLLNRYAPYLTQEVGADRFAFYGTVLRGAQTQEPLWKRGVRLVDGELGEAVGKVYVEKHFPPEHKARMEKLVGNLLKAYRLSIDKLDWMSPATKKQAQAKLAKFVTKIGYPKKWRDYSKLDIRRDDLVGNLQRSAHFEYQRQIAKLGKPIDRQEWLIAPQVVNAYYDPSMNEIVFPAAILQPPFFDANADDAVNYGGIGGVIGHEISHGFDDEGSQFDGNGNLRDWWTKADREKFSAKTKVLVAQYNGYSPVPGYQVNGELTLGENIADNSGLAIALKAYQLSLGGKASPVIDGRTGEQRLFLGWAQAWREKGREADLIRLIKSDPHSPAPFRGNGALRNASGFYEAFDVKEGDKMYLPPEQRVSIW